MDKKWISVDSTEKLEQKIGELTGNPNMKVQGVAFESLNGSTKSITFTTAEGIPLRIEIDSCSLKISVPEPEKQTKVYKIDGRYGKDDQNLTIVASYFRDKRSAEQALDSLIETLTGEPLYLDGTKLRNDITIKELTVPESQIESFFKGL